MDGNRGREGREKIKQLPQNETHGLESQSGKMF